VLGLVGLFDWFCKTSTFEWHMSIWLMLAMLSFSQLKHSSDSGMVELAKCAAIDVLLFSEQTPCLSFVDYLCRLSLVL